MQCRISGSHHTISPSLKDHMQYSTVETHISQALRKSARMSRVYCYRLYSRAHGPSHRYYSRRPRQITRLKYPNYMGFRCISTFLHKYPNKGLQRGLTACIYQVTAKRVADVALRQWKGGGSIMPCRNIFYLKLPN